MLRPILSLPSIVAGRTALDTSSLVKSGLLRDPTEIERLGKTIEPHGERLALSRAYGRQGTGRVRSVERVTHGGVVDEEPGSLEAVTEGPRIQTFLIADVRGYTLFTQQRGDEAAAKLTAKFCNPEIDRRIQRALDLEPTDPHASARALQVLGHDLVDLAPMIPYAAAVDLWLVSKRVSNVEFSPLFRLIVSQVVGPLKWREAFPRAVTSSRPWRRARPQSEPAPPPESM